MPSKFKLNLASLDTDDDDLQVEEPAPPPPKEDLRPLIYICFQTTRYGDMQENVLVGVVDGSPEQKALADRWANNDPRRQVIPWRIGKLGIEGPGV